MNIVFSLDQIQEVAEQIQKKSFFLMEKWELGKLH
jgi:hypothetical protein